MTADLSIVSATPSRWDDVAQIFGRRGDPARCWCQFHCTTGRTYSESARANRDALRRQLRGRPPPGLVAYCEGEPVGWVRLGPIDRFSRVTGNRLRRGAVGDDPQGLWTVTCFVVPPKQRRSGVATALVDAATDFARGNGASTLEAHPVDTQGRRAAGDALYHGVLSTFLAVGFTEIGRTGPKRPIVRLEL